MQRCSWVVPLVVPEKRAKLLYEPEMPPIGSPLHPLVVFSSAILTPDIYCVSVFYQNISTNFELVLF